MINIAARKPIMSTLDLNKISRFILAFFFFLALFVGICISRTFALQYATRNSQQKLTSVAQQVSETVMNYTHICDTIAANDNVLQCASMGHIAHNLINTIQVEMANTVSISSINRNQVALFFINNPIIVTPSQYYINPNYATFFSHWYGNALTMESLSDYIMQDSKSWHTYCFDSRSWLIRTVFVEEVPVAFIVLEFDLPNILSDSGDLLIFIGNATECIYSNLLSITQKKYLEILNSFPTNRNFLIGGKTYAITRNVFSIVDLNIFTGVRHTAMSQTVLVNTLWIAGTLALVLLCMLAVRRLCDNDNFGKSSSNAEACATLSPLELGLLLQSILGMSDPDTSLAQRCLAAAGIPANSDYFIVGFSYLEDSHGLFKPLESRDSKSSEHSMPYFVLNNVLQDLLFDKRPGSLCIVRNYYIALAGRFGQEQPDDIAEIAEQLVSFFREHFAVSIAFTQPVLNTAAGLKGTVESTLSEISHKSFWRCTVKSEALNNNSSSMVFYKLMGKMRICFENEKYDEAANIFNEMIEKHLPTNIADINIARNRIYSIFDMLVSVSGIQMDNFDLKLTNLDNIVDFRNASKKIFNELIFRQQLNKTNTTTQKHVNEVKEYVLVHLADSTLSVSTIAEHLGLNSTYLSRIFKENTGMNLLEYIQRVRVNTAKELLYTHSVKDAATEVGFWDMQTFVRVFKKYEGVTPAGFKKLSSSGDT